jgi:hypothetical protein
MNSRRSLDVDSNNVITRVQLHTHINTYIKYQKKRREAVLKYKSYVNRAG